MKNYFIAILSLLSFSCTAQTAKDNSQEIIHYLTHAIKSTAYSALAKETSVQFVGQLFDENPDDDLIEEEYRIKAKVLETYRGKVLTELAYTVIVEKGESINIKSHPVILTLCEYEQGF